MLWTLQNYPDPLLNSLCTVSGLDPLGLFDLGPSDSSALLIPVDAAEIRGILFKYAVSPIELTPAVDAR